MQTYKGRGDLLLALPSAIPLLLRTIGHHYFSINNSTSTRNDQAPYSAVTIPLLLGTLQEIDFFPMHKDVLDKTTKYVEKGSLDAGLHGTPDTDVVNVGNRVFMTSWSSIRIGASLMLRQNTLSPVSFFKRQEYVTKPDVKWH
ncbi:hypothetical protein Csa_014764 [Cucumis sativus]|uniref:Uncharacterized protein n=1 Tax=Cucumis sativus TaxID=3659 RepID=A0A0A0KZB1_CUCSA|nr:hypothetical protein Csa_014764 [Cucumis sativus]